MKKENFENYDYLTETVFPRFGVEGVFNKKLETEMDKGIPVIELKAGTTYKSNEDQMIVTFRVEKSDSDDKYYLNRADASLTRKDGEVQKQVFRIYNQRGFDIDQMHNIMEGRFVHREYLRDGERKSGWSFLDHNRKDDLGNSIVRTLSDDITKFNLLTALSKIPMEYMPQNKKEEMLIALKNGDPISKFVKAPDGTRKEADLLVQPQSGTVVAYDKEGNKISFDNKQSKIVAIDDVKGLSKTEQILEKSMNGIEQSQGKSNKK